EVVAEVEPEDSPGDGVDVRTRRDARIGARLGRDRDRLPGDLAAVALRDRLGEALRDEGPLEVGGAHTRVDDVRHLTLPGRAQEAEVARGRGALHRVESGVG